MKIRIPLVLASDGHWCTNAASYDDGWDWGTMEVGADVDADQLATARYLVTVELPEPPAMVTLEGAIAEVSG